MGEKLIVTAKYGNLEYTSEAKPYNPKAHDEQYDSCVSNIYEQMKKAGRYEMRDSFTFSDDVK